MEVGSNILEITKALNEWENLQGGKTKNPDIIWFPKPSADLQDMREKLKIALAEQIENQNRTGKEFFVENNVAKKLVELGAMTRPSTPTESIITDYDDESDANKPHLSSFRMQNRLFRFLGWTTRAISNPNEYVVTKSGKQIASFGDIFPGQLGALREDELVIKSLVEMSLFSVNDSINQWDTRFRQRIVVNTLHYASLYGYITNNELVVTAFAVKNENDRDEMDNPLKRLQYLHEGKISMKTAFEQVNVDPMNKSAVNNAYDSPKVLLSLCRQVGLLQNNGIKDSSFGDLTPVYAQMYPKRTYLKKPRVVNEITPLGRRILARELSKKLVCFEELW